MIKQTNKQKTFFYSKNKGIYYINNIVKQNKLNLSPVQNRTEQIEESKQVSSLFSFINFYEDSFLATANKNRVFGQKNK